MNPDYSTESQNLTVAVVGLGLLGRGIATCFLGNGFRVIGCDTNAEKRNQARRYIERGLRELSEHSQQKSASTDGWRDRYHETGAFGDWPECGFVVETIDESMTAKQRAFDEIEAIVGQEVPIGSNTSSIPITQLQEGRRNPSRLFGMHWFEPAHATRFLELIPGDRTSLETMSFAVAVARRCDKDPCVLTKETPGFIVNRLGYAMYREALHLLELGVADVDTIDRSFRNACGVWSTVFGPFQWLDLTGGPELYAECMRRVLPTLSNAIEPPESIELLVRDGARGVINGRGFYNYTPEQAANADRVFHEHAWTARAIADKYYPLNGEVPPAKS